MTLLVLYPAFHDTHNHQLLAARDLDYVPGSVAGDGLGIWGLKLGMDGGIEGGFLCQPYANNPNSGGHIDTAGLSPGGFERSDGLPS